jgi:lysophospholipase L1-like esterase
VFTRYIALGDSVSIDLYPALDAGEIDVAVALERTTSAGHVAPIGAASLLYQNSEAHWPDFMGEDLSTLSPGIELQVVADDGATIGDVFGEQLPLVAEGDDPVLVTLTIGGNDLLSALANRPRRSLLERIEQDIEEAYDFLLETLRARLPNGVYVLTTVYDPSDRSGKIPGVFEEAGPLPLDVLDRFNAYVRRLASGTPRAVLADVYAHFLGHGVAAEEADRWYWRRSLIEPGARGASEVRRVWLDALHAAGALED